MLDLLAACGFKINIAENLKYTPIISDAPSDKIELEIKGFC